MKKRLFRKMLALTLGLCMTGSMATVCLADEQMQQEIIFADTTDCGDINPHLYDGDMISQALVFEPLVLSGENGIEPCLASEWEISEDGLEYIFHLRDDVYFTNGEKFNAEIAKANIDAVQGNKDRHSWMGIAGRIDSCEVVDEYTIKLNLTESI